MAIENTEYFSLVEYGQIRNSEKMVRYQKRDMTLRQALKE
jgi:hypothetical protein